MHLFVGGGSLTWLYLLSFKDSVLKACSHLTFASPSKFNIMLVAMKMQRREWFQTYILRLPLRHH